MKKEISLLKSNNYITKIFLFCSLVIISIGGTSAFALDLMGPPVTNLRQSQFQSAIEYSQSSIKLQLVNGIYNDDVIGGLFLLWLQLRK